MAVFLRKYRKMLLCGVFCFYLGCMLNLNYLKTECTESVKTVSSLMHSAAEPHSSVEYAVVILSGVDGEKERNTIRATWMKLACNVATESGSKVYRWRRPTPDYKLPYFIKVYFAVGIQFKSRHDTLKLIYENEQNKDLLLLENVQEGYSNLSKKMLRTIEWLSKNLKNLKYIIKCDEDSFVRIDLIIKILETYGPNLTAPDLAKYISYKEDSTASTLGLYWGYFNGKAHVYRVGKWEEKDWFQCDNYLPYALGGGYVISRHIVDYIGSNADWLNTYKSEDVSMGLWTSALRGVLRVHDIRFDTEWESRGCQHHMLVRHKQNTTQMLAMFTKLVTTNGEKLCPIVTEVRKSYRYNWNEPTSKCCK